MKQLVGALALAGVAQAQSLEHRVKPDSIVVDLAKRTILATQGKDTLLFDSVAVSMDKEFCYQNRCWQFKTPRRIYRVQGKRTDPIWTAPEWQYAHFAADNNIRFEQLTRPVPIDSGRTLLMRNDTAMVRAADGSYGVPPIEEYLVFPKKSTGALTVFIPPLRSVNAKQHGALGKYAVDLGNGYMLHGTPQPSTIGTAVTHGCVRLRDDAIKWVYDHVKPGDEIRIR